MTTNSPGPIQQDRRRDPQPAALRAVLALPPRRRLDRLAAGDGLRPARARQGRRRGERGSGARSADAVPGVPDIVIAPRVEGQFDAAIIMECGDLGRDRRRRPRAVLRDQHRSPSRQHRLRADQLVRRERRGVRRAGLRPRRALPVSADQRRSRPTSTSRSSPTPARSTTSSISPRTFDICREVPRGGRRPGAGRAERVRQQQHGRLKLFGAVLSAMQLDAERTDRDRLRRSRDGARGRRHLRGHRGPHQPAAHGQGDRGGGVLQADRGRASTASACGPRATSTSAPSRRSSAAAGTRTRRAARCRGGIDALQKLFIEKIEAAINGRAAHHR